MKTRPLVLLAAVSLVVTGGDVAADDEFLTDLYRSLNDSPMQRKLRQLRPFPVGVVYYQQRHHDLAAIKRELAVIKETGFDALKQIVLHDRSMLEIVQNAALDIGLYPWYYGLAGWLPIDEPLLDRLGIPRNTPMAQIQQHPAMVQHQMAALRRRISDARKIPDLPTYAKKGEPGRGHPFLSDKLVPLFADWLQKTYGDVASMERAWNTPWTGGRGLGSFEKAAQKLSGNRESDPTHDFRRYRDSMRFQADLAVADYDKLMKHHLRYEPWEPVRTGGHHLFDNQALSGWDLEAQAHAAAQGGSFYASVHLAHHLREVAGEVDRPVYLQARIIADSFKGGWSAIWESTGGPTMWSGQNSFSVDAGTITRLMLSYVGAGLKGIGFWSWNARDLGWEGGEYALIDLNGRVTERARTAGAIARALQKHRFELWDAGGDPQVGILYSWENEAMLGRLSLGAGPTNRALHFQKQGNQARVGLGRALMNANVPFEFVSERDLRAGLAPRYKVIYMPHVLALPPDVLEKLATYVQGGGRLVADMPLLLMDDHGRRFPTGAGSAFEALFGATLDDFRNTQNDPQRWGGLSLTGQYAELTPTRARVSHRFVGGAPAVLEVAHGKGRAIIVNGELSRMAFRPGQQVVEARLLEVTMGGLRPAFRADGVLAYRRSAPTADHYFLVNEGDARTITLSAPNRKYLRGEDAVTNAVLPVRAGTLRVAVPARSGRWVRLVRSGG